MGDEEIARRVAAASFVQIAYLTDSVGRPVLLPMCGVNHLRADLLAKLWRHGLKDEHARADAWEALAQWRQAVDRHSALRVPFEHLLETLESTDDDFRVRVRWYLRLWSSHAKRTSAVGDTASCTRGKE